MDTTARTQLLALLHGRQAAITDHWYRAVSQTGCVSISAAALRSQLAALTEQAITLLLADPFDQQRARAIGAALPRLRSMQPEVLGRTIDVLASQLVAGLPAEQVVALVPRLAALLGEVAAGFASAARAVLLADQEGMIHAVLDARTRTAAALRTTEERLATIVSNLPVFLFALDRDGVFTLAEGKGLADVGITPDMWVGQSVFELADHRPQTLQRVRHALAGEPLSITAKLRGAIFDVRYLPLRDEHGDVNGIIGVAMNVTRRARAEEALRESEARFRTVFTGAAIGIALVAMEDWQIVEVNPALEAMLGYRAGELRGRQFREISHPDDAMRFTFLYEELLAGKFDSCQWEKRYIRKDGQIVWARVTMSYTRDPDRGTGFVIGTIEDITERRAMEQALRQSEVRFRSAFDDAAIGMALVGFDGRWLQVNRALCRIVGYSEQELLSMTFQEITHPDDLETDLDYVRRMLAGEISTYQMEKRYIHKLGHIVRTLLSVSLVRDTAGNPLYFIPQIQDITEQKRIETELAAARRRLAEEKETERLHLAQELHDGVAQQVLGMSYQIAELKRRACDSKQSAAQRLAALAGALDDVQQGLLGIVTQLRSTISELRPAGLRELGLSSALKGYVARLQREAGQPLPDIELDLDQTISDVPELVAVCLFRVAQEALRNALKHAHPRRITICLRLAFDQAVLSVTDDGCGFEMPVHLVDFAQANHFGLVGIAERAAWVGGQCVIRSQPGVGTTVEVRIPLEATEGSHESDYSCIARR